MSKQRNNYSLKIFIIAFLASLLVGFSSCSRKHTQAPARILTAAHAALPEFFDARPSHIPTSYLYAPGLTGTEMLMGRYCPHFIASTGEKITWRSGGHVIGQPHTAVVFPEICLNKPTVFTLNPITAIINGIRQDLFPLVQRYLQDTFDFTVEDNAQSSKSVVNYGFQFGRANIGQSGDIRALRKAYARHLQKYPDTYVVLYGDSRGAATLFNFIARHNPSRVKAAVLEGIFDTIPHCIKHFLYHDKDPETETRLHNILRFVMGSYQHDAPSPRVYAEMIRDEIPLLLVTSLHDGLVAPQCTLALYKQLQQRGHRLVHILVLKTAKHPSYMISDREDKICYESVVHAFYKHYGLPHNGEKAAAGLQAFLVSQPPIDELEQSYPLVSCIDCR